MASTDYTRLTSIVEVCQICSLRKDDVVARGHGNPPPYWRGLSMIYHAPPAGSRKRPRHKVVANPFCKLIVIL